MGDAWTREEIERLTAEADRRHQAWVPEEIERLDFVRLVVGLGILPQPRPSPATAYDTARALVKTEGHSRAFYVLQRDAALAEVVRLRARADANAAMIDWYATQLSEARAEVDRLREARDEALADGSHDRAESRRLRRLVLRDHAQGHRPHADCPACQKLGLRTGRR